MDFKTIISKMKLKITTVIIIIFIIGLGTGLIFEKKISPPATALPENNLIPLNIPIPSNWKSKESAPGNSFNTAIDIVPGYGTQGTLNPGNILDYFKFNLKDPAKITVTVSNLPQEFGFILYDANLNQVAQTIRSGSTEGTTTISLSNPGKYYIKVFADYTQIVNVPYDIRMSIQPFFNE